MVMAPVLLVTEELAQKMKDSGIMRVSLSIDGLTAEQHNNFRRVEGAFESVMKAIENFKKVGMEFQVNTTITKHNVKDLPKLLEMVIGLGAVAYHPFLLVPTGRGKDLIDQEIPPAEYESTLKWFYEMRDKVPIQFKPTCAPHYYRIFRQGEKEKGKTVTPEVPWLRCHDQGLYGRPELRLRIPRGQGADLWVPRRRGGGHHQGAILEDLERVAAVQGDARPRPLPRQVRDLRVPKGVRRLPRKGVRDLGRLSCLRAVLYV